MRRHGAHRRGGSADNVHTYAWQRMRKAILIRDHGVCGYCGAFATTVDHRVRRENGGRSTPDNLVACCVRCQTESNRPKRFFIGEHGLDARLDHPSPLTGRIAPIRKRIDRK